MSRNQAKTANKNRQQQQAIQRSNTVTTPIVLTGNAVVAMVENDFTLAMDDQANTVVTVTPTVFSDDRKVTEGATISDQTLTVKIDGDDKEYVGAAEVHAALSALEDYSLPVVVKLNHVETSANAPEEIKPLGNHKVKLFKVSANQATYTKGKGEISDVAAAIGFPISRISVDHGFGITFNFDVELTNTVSYTATVSVQNSKPVTLELSNVSGGVGFILPNQDLAVQALDITSQGGYVGFDLTIEKSVVEEEVNTDVFDPNVRPDIFKDEDEVVNAFLLRLWGYVSKMHVSLVQTPQSVAHHTGTLIHILDQITTLETELFGTVMGSFEDIFEVYKDTVFSERLVTRGVSSVSNQHSVQRLLAMMNILRVVNGTNNPEKVYLVLDLGNLHLHGFDAVQSNNINTYFSVN